MYGINTDDVFLNSYSPTGILVFAPSQSEKFHATVASLKANGEEHEVLTAEEVNSRYFEQLQLPDDYMGVFEKDGGVLLANKAVAAYQVGRYTAS